MEIKVPATQQGLTDLIKGAQQQQLQTKKTAATPMIETGLKTQDAQKQTPEQKEELLKKQVDSLNELMQSNMTNIKFNVHEDLERMFVQIVNKETDEVIKEIPSEQFLDMVASMLKFAGLIVDERI